LSDLVGEDEAYITAEIPRLIEGALSVDNRVTGVDNYVFTRTSPDSMGVSFTVHTVFGDFEGGIET
jgi:hypothetical protein